MNTSKENTITYLISNEKELPALAQKVLSFDAQNKIFILEGDLGAGKTTLVKAIAKELNCSEAITSPTYSIVNEYETQEKTTIFHFDLYRIKDLEEIENIGFWEYLNNDAYVFIEWGQLILNQLDKYVHIKIRTLANQSRKVTLTLFSQ